MYTFQCPETYFFKHIYHFLDLLIMIGRNGIVLCSRMSSMTGKCLTCLSACATTSLGSHKAFFRKFIYGLQAYYKQKIEIAFGKHSIYEEEILFCQVLLCSANSAANVKLFCLVQIHTYPLLM